MTRAVRTLAATVACAALVAGCGLLPAAPGTLAAADQACNPDKITFAIGPDDIGWLPPIITRWNAARLGVPVQLLYLPPAADGQLAQLVADLQAKSCLYDVIDMDVVWTAQFASSRWIIPLDGYPTGGFLTPAVKTAAYKGRPYAVPYYTNADLLYYRTDIVKKPTTTWAGLAKDAMTDARPAGGLYGYAATLAPYEGLTVNFAEAVQSANGSILSADGTHVTVDSPQARAGLTELVSGVQAGWIPKADLRYEETQAQDEFEAGHFVFMNNWPDAYAAMQADPGSKVRDKFRVAALPGPSSLGGANLAISAYSRHKQAARDFISYLTDAANERTMLIRGSFAPVLESLYDDPALRARYPYLAVLKQSIQDARPRPAVTDYAQASLAISGEVYQALQQGETSGRPPADISESALADMADQLRQLIGGS
jgi:multiple sugar transport system substrate-binding protein